MVQTPKTSLNSIIYICYTRNELSIKYSKYGAKDTGTRFVGRQMGRPMDYAEDNQNLGLSGRKDTDLCSMSGNCITRTRAMFMFSYA